MTTAAVERLASRLVGLEKQVRGLSLPSLGYSTIEGGGIEVVDDDGNPTGTIGNLPDGSGAGFNPINGQRPPTPTAPILTKVSGGLKVEWDGKFVGDAIVPLNFSRVEVHVGDASGFYNGSALWLRGTIESPRGGAVVVVPLAKETKYAVLVARSLSGLASSASVEVSGMPGGFFTDEDQARIDADLAENAAALAENAVELARLDQVQVTLKSDLAASNVRVDQALADGAAAQATADQAIADGAAAKARADQAVIDAAAAAQKATAAQTTADGKGKVFYQTTPPTASSNFDIWFDTDADNLPHQWNGTAWVAQPLGNAAIGNLTAAKITTGEMSGARISAGTLDAGKITTGELSGARIAAGTLDAGKITFGTMSGERISAGTLDAGKITFGEMSGARISTGTLDAGKITTGQLSGDRIAAGTLDAGKITFGQMHGDRIVAYTLHANRIVGKTITANEIQGNSITTASGVIGDLSADYITAGTIQADRLSAASLTGRTITGGVIQTGTSGNRVVLNGGSQNRVEWSADDRNAHIRLDGSGINYTMTIQGPWDSLGGEWIHMSSAPAQIIMGVYGAQGGGGDLVRIRHDSQTGVGYTEMLNNARLYITDEGIWSGGTKMMATVGNPIFLYSGSNTRVSTPGVVYVQDAGATVYKPIYASQFSVQSSEAVKRSVAAAPAALEVIRRLRPVTYRRKAEPNGRAMRGFLAEEVANVDDTLITPMAALDPADPVGDSLGLDLASMLSLALQGIAELAALVPAANRP